MRDVDSDLTASRMRHLFDYKIETGALLHRVRRNKVFPGTRAGSQNENGYRQVRIDGRIYAEHRVIWLFVMGQWPSHELDHRDGRKNNNRFHNLRPATTQQNSFNRVGKPGERKSRYIGVILKTDRPRAKPWAASITVDGQRIPLGYFGTEEAAGEARLRAERRYHGAYAHSLSRGGRRGRV